MNYPKTRLGIHQEPLYIECPKKADDKFNTNKKYHKETGHIT